MKFLVDAQLPPSLAAWLRARGHDAAHVEDVRLRDGDDADVRRFAEANRSIIVTKDRDFLVSPVAVETPPIIWVRTGNVPNRVLFERFEINWPRIEDYLVQGFLVVEIR